MGNGRRVLDSFTDHHRAHLTSPAVVSISGCYRASAFLDDRFAANPDRSPGRKQFLVTMVDDVTEPLVRQFQLPCGPRHTATGLQEGGADQLSLALVHLLLKRATTRGFPSGRSGIGGAQAGTSTQTGHGCRVQGLG